MQVGQLIIVAGEVSTSFPEGWAEVLASRFTSAQNVRVVIAPTLGHLVAMESPSLTASYIAQVPTHPHALHLTHTLSLVLSLSLSLSLWIVIVYRSEAVNNKIENYLFIRQ